MRQTPVDDYLEEISTELPEELYGNLSDAIYETVCEFDKDVAQLKAENAKLRELSSIMLKCIKANERKALICWECPMHKQFDELRSYCCLEHEAKKMGVEADE